MSQLSCSRNIIKSLALDKPSEIETGQKKPYLVRWGR